MNIYTCGGQSTSGISNIVYNKLGIKNIKSMHWDNTGIYYHMKDGTIERVGLFSQFKKEQNPNIQKIVNGKITKL
jgi:hypothetical protein